MWWWFRHCDTSNDGCPCGNSATDHDRSTDDDRGTDHDGGTDDDRSADDDNCSSRYDCRPNHDHPVRSSVRRWRPSC